MDIAARPAQEHDAPRFSGALYADAPTVKLSDCAAPTRRSAPLRGRGCPDAEGARVRRGSRPQVSSSPAEAGCAAARAPQGSRRAPPRLYAHSAPLTAPPRMPDTALRARAARTIPPPAAPAAAPQRRMLKGSRAAPERFRAPALAFLVVIGLVAAILAFSPPFHLARPHFARLLAGSSASAAPGGRAPPASGAPSGARTLAAAPTAPARPRAPAPPRAAAGPGGAPPGGRMFTYRAPIVVPARTKHTATMIMLREPAAGRPGWVAEVGRWPRGRRRHRRPPTCGCLLTRAQTASATRATAGRASRGSLRRSCRTSSSSSRTRRRGPSPSTWGALFDRGGAEGQGWAEHRAGGGGGGQGAEG
jgi:hypothetical protein